MTQKEYQHGWYLANRERKLALHRAWRLANPSYMKNYHEKNGDPYEAYRRNETYKRKYGISSADYDFLFAKQNGVCALCLHPPKKVRLAVDHNHITKRIRGLLCTACNRVVMGRIDTVPGYLERIIAYAQP